MSLSFTRDGTVLESTELEERARRNGMCHLCGECKTHEKVKKGLLMYEWKPLTVGSEGCYEVYKGYCLHPRCYTLKQAKRALGEDKGIDRRRKARSSRRVLQDTSHNGAPSSSTYASSSSLPVSDASKPSPSRHATSEIKPPSGMHTSNTTLETVSLSSGSRGSDNAARAAERATNTASPTLQPATSIRCIEVDGQGEESPSRFEEHDWEWDATRESNHSPSTESRRNSRSSNRDFSSNERSSEQQEESIVKVSEIKALIAQIGDNVGFAIEVLVNFMEANPDVEVIQAHCLSTISNLSKNNETNKDLIMASGALEKIFAAMSNHTTSSMVQERACTALWSLAVKEDHRRKLVRGDACSHVLNALEQNLTEKGVAGRAMGALLTFSSESECRVDLRIRHAKKLVLQAMKLHPEVSSIQRDGCIILSNIAVDLESREVAIVSPEEVEAVALAVENHKREAPVILGACFALTNCVHNEQNLKSATELDRLLSLLDEVSKEIQDDEAKHALADVLYELHARRAASESIEDTVSSDLIKQARRQGSGDVVGSTIRVMRDYKWSDKVTCSGLQCLWLVVNQLSDSEHVVDGRIIQETISAMRRQLGCPDVQEKGCELLECLARLDAAEISSIVRAGGSRAIVAAMREHQENERVQRSAFEALYVLSAEFECWFDIEQNGSIDDIKQAVEQNRNSAVVQRRGRSILSNFNAQSCRF